MTCYVNPAQRRGLAGVRWSGVRWCRMVSDAADPAFTELHAMAARIGLRKAWFQDDHYDLTPTKREAALLAGAQAVEPRALVLLGYPRGPDRQARMLQTEDGRRALLNDLGEEHVRRLAAEAAQKKLIAHLEESVFASLPLHRGDVRSDAGPLLVVSAATTTDPGPLRLPREAPDAVLDEAARRASDELARLTRRCEALSAVVAKLPHCACGKPAPYEGGGWYYCKGCRGSRATKALPWAQELDSLEKVR